MKHDPTTTHALELFDGSGVVSGFSNDCPVVHAGDLIGADDERFVVSGRHGVGLLVGEARSQGFRRLAGMRVFVDVGRIGVVLDADLLQEHPSIARTGGQNDARFVGKHHDF
jgi:hypothetical protein